MFSEVGTRNLSKGTLAGQRVEFAELQLRNLHVLWERVCCCEASNVGTCQRAASTICKWICDVHAVRWWARQRRRRGGYRACLVYYQAGALFFSLVRSARNVQDSVTSVTGSSNAGGSNAGGGGCGGGGAGAAADGDGGMVVAMVHTSLTSASHPPLITAATTTTGDGEETAFACLCLCLRLLPCQTPFP